MLFSSSVFLFLFLPAALIGYQIFSRFGRAAMLFWLAAISLFFYGYWNPPYLILLGLSILINFAFSFGVDANRSESTRSRMLFAAITVDLLGLVYYKYLFPLLNFFHTHGALPHAYANVLLPLGISFFTFTQIAYLIDLRQGIAKRQGILAYTVFVTFFPHLIAGPIIHPRELMPQLEKGRIGGLRADDLTLGVSWFVLGLGKKVLLADRISPLADLLFNHTATAGMSLSWLGAIAYTMQLYFDFSGYSDMALGLARMFSLEFPINFDSPYKSSGIVELWQRWHMTLSRYLNEYLYTPISRSINGRRMDKGWSVSRKAVLTPRGFFDMIVVPTMFTMFIAGIWHGAGVQYLIFGVLQAVYLIVNHAWRYLTPRGHRLHAAVPRPFMVVLTFLAFMVSLVFFRAGSVQDAGHILATMAGVHGSGASYASNPFLSELPSIAVYFKHIQGALAACAVCLFIVWALPNTQEILNQIPKTQLRLGSILPRLRWRPSLLWCVALTGVLCLSILLLDAGTTFLYFQF